MTISRDIVSTSLACDHRALSWTTQIGGQPMNLGVHYYRNVASTPASGDNQLRLQVSFLFPEKKPAAATVQTATR